MQKTNNTSQIFLTGFSEAFGMPALIISTTMLGFGALAKTTNFDITSAILSTVLIWGLPGQVAMLEALATGVPFGAIILSVVMANMRFLPMAVSLIPLFQQDPIGWRWRYALVHFMSVNTWVGLQRRASSLAFEHRATYFFGFSMICMIGGVIGTILGFYLANFLPFTLTATLVFLNPIYFSLVFLEAQGRALKLAIFFGCILGPALYLLTPDWSLPLVGVLAGTAAFILDRHLTKLDA